MTMVDIRSDKHAIDVERRQDPRLEFHCDAAVPDLCGIQTITDISLGGLFLETSNLDTIDVGRVATINTRLHSDTTIFRLKAEVLRQTNRGIGCRFVELNDRRKDAIRTCFERFKDTLPALQR